jgi:hypothetical protein
LLIGAEKLDAPEIAAPLTGAASASAVPLRLNAIAAIAANILIFMNFPKFEAGEGNRTLVFSLGGRRPAAQFQRVPKFCPCDNAPEAVPFSDSIFCQKSKSIGRRHSAT